MATTTIELSGILTWAKLFESNRDMGDFDKETNGACTIDLIMDEENFKAMKDSGVRKQGKPDPEGRGTVVKFKRPFEDKFGRDWAGGVPSVFRPDGTAWNADTDGLIGNGSIGVVFVDVYDTKMGKGCRLSGVQVIDHVEFEGGGGGVPSKPQPKDYTATASTKSAAPQEVGEVPF